jgi:cytoskeleton protein RodZ
MVALVWWAMHVPHASRSTPIAGPAAANPAAPKESTAKVDLGLKFRQGSWAEIYDAAGTRLFSEFGSAGSERRLNGTAPLSILLGDASAVSLELDGQPVALGDSAMGGSALRFSLDGGGRLFDVQAPHPAPARSRAPRR